MKFDACAANSGSTVNTADCWPACLITLDDDTCSDCKSIDIQIKRATVLSVGILYELLLQQRVIALCKGKLFSHSHYSEVLDPPVSTQTDEGVTNTQSDSSPRHKFH